MFAILFFFPCSLTGTLLWHVCTRILPWWPVHCNRRRRRQGVCDGVLVYCLMESWRIVLWLPHITQVKLWNTSSGLCITTFTEHTGVMACLAIHYLDPDWSSILYLDFHSLAHSLTHTRMYEMHTGGITGVRMTQNGLSILSSSLDGTVRAFDRIRYRNYRTFTTPHPTQVCIWCESGSSRLVSQLNWLNCGTQ